MSVLHLMLSSRSFSQIYRKNEALNEELRRYDPVSDAQGGHPYAGPGGVTRYTQPGGHYQEIRDLQRGLRNDLERYNRRRCGASPNAVMQNSRYGGVPLSVAMQAVMVMPASHDADLEDLSIRLLALLKKHGLNVAPDEKEGLLLRAKPRVKRWIADQL